MRVRRNRPAQTLCINRPDPCQAVACWLTVNLRKDTRGTHAQRYVHDMAANDDVVMSLASGDPFVNE